MTNREIWMLEVLDCGIADLRLVDDVGYQMGDIFDFADSRGYDRNTLGELMDCVFRYGFFRIHQDIDDRVCEPEAVAGVR